jgi:hypothetical protein
MGSPFAASIGQGYLEERRRVDVVDRAAVHAGASVVSRTTGKHMQCPGACDKEPLAEPLQTEKGRFT